MALDPRGAQFEVLCPTVSKQPFYVILYSMSHQNFILCEAPASMPWNRDVTVFSGYHFKTKSKISYVLRLA